MNKIEQLKKSLEANEYHSSTLIAELQEEYNKVFNDSSVLHKAISALDQSKDFQFNEAGEIECYIKCYDLTDFEDCKEYLETWLQDTHFINVDWENSCLSALVGGCFIINDSGDVYDTDSGKRFLSKYDYIEGGEINETLRNKLIEEHMERTGYFPSVFSVDRHNNVFLVNTKE